MSGSATFERFWRNQLNRIKERAEQNERAIPPKEKP